MAVNVHIRSSQKQLFYTKQFIVTVHLVLVLFSCKLYAACSVVSPVLRCIQVQANGDAILTWTLPPATDPSLNSYHIYQSPSLNGPYTVVDSIFNTAQTTYTHVGANANAAPVYYYIQSRCTGYQYSAAEDTLASININVVNPLNGTAIVSWNSPRTPLLATAASSYTVNERFAGGSWTSTGIKTNNNAVAHNFIDTIFLCNGNIDYRITISDNSGCSSVSSIDGGNFANAVLPSIPVIDTVSVDDNNITHLSWNQNSHPDVEGYIIYRFNGAAWVPLVTLLGIANTSFTNTLSTASSASEQYRIAAYDTCGNLSPQSGMETTIFVSAKAEVCSSSAILSWTEYSAIGNGLAGYRIYRSSVSQAGPYVLDGTVSAGSLSYTAGGLTPQTTYYFKVVAFDNSGTKTTSSNRISFYSASPPAPAYLYLKKVSVLSPTSVEIVCYTDPTSPVTNYKVMKAISSDTSSVGYEQIGVIPKSTSETISYVDNDVDTDNNSYMYKIIVVDSCGFDAMETNSGKTMLLKAEGEGFVFKNNLMWTHYKEWPKGVVQYNIYRGKDGKMESTPVAKVTPDITDTNNYTDNVSHVLADKGEFSYYIEAVEANGNPYGFVEKSVSNIAIAKQESLVYIPNAFAPEGLYNRMFKPVVTYVDYGSYEFTVFNRIGNIVFSTTDVEQGWDGTMGGVSCEVGVYVYTVKLKNSRGKDRIYRGTVTLLK